MAARRDLEGSAKERAVAVEATGANARDILLINPAGGEMRTGVLRLTGQGALLHYDADKLTRLLVAGDSQVHLGDALLAQPG